jgi:amino acid adenylation domain-containing protein
MKTSTDGARNFYDVVRYWAAQRPHQLAFEFLPDGEVGSDVLTFVEVDRKARAIAADLQARDLKGAPVLLQYGTGLDFILGFLGCLYAGAIGVSAYPPPANRSKLDRLEKLIASSSVRAVLTNGATATDLRREAQGDGDARSRSAALPLICTDAIDERRADDWHDPLASADDIAFLQYSSGSTGDAKGVIVSHGNILHNQEMIQRAMGNGQHTVVASWLPLFHDMGLIGNVMQPLYLGVPCHLMPPIAFLQKPERWLRLIARRRVTCTGGPNFAYDLCVDRVSEAERAGLDLSSWSVAYNGAEPVAAATLRRFRKTYAPFGLRESALYPCYGLAEGTLFVTGPEPGSGARVVELDGDALAKGSVLPSAPGRPGARAIVGCGRVAWGQTLRIVDPETRRSAPAGAVGEVWIAGPSVSQGYWQNPEATAATFQSLADEPNAGRFCRTGDLGFVHDGELFVTGRIKEVLIVRGQNHYPHDIEATVQRSFPDLAPRGGAAFSVPGRDGERLVVVHEVSRAALGRFDTIAAFEAARAAVAAEHGLTLSELVAIKPGSLAKTSSGKIRRGFIRDAFVSGGLARLEAEPRGQDRQKGEPEPRIAPALLQALAGVGIPAERVTLEASLMRYGLDSLKLVELQTRIARALGVWPPLEWLLRPWSLRELGAALATLSPRPAEPAATLPDVSGPALLTPYQLSVLLRQEQAPAAPMFNLGVTLELTSDVKPGQIVEGLSRLLADEPQLRSVVRGSLSQSPEWVVGEVGAPLEREPAEGWTETRIAERLESFHREPFQLERQPPFRALLLERSTGYLLALSIHHVATDLHGGQLLLRRLLGFIGGEPPAQPPASPAAVLAELRRLDSAAPEPDPAWVRQLAAATPTLALGLAKPTADGRITARLDAELPPWLLGELRRVAEDAGATLNTITCAVFAALLHRYTGQSSVCLGMPMSVRTEALAHWSGNAVNLVPLAIAFEAETRFDQLIEAVAKAIAAGLQHRHLALPRLSNAVRASDPRRMEPFNALFVCQPQHGADDVAALAIGGGGWQRHAGVAVRARAVSQPASQAQLSLLVFPGPDGARLVLEFDPDQVPAEVAQRMLSHYRGMAEALVRERSAPVRFAEYLSPGEVTRQWHGSAAIPSHGRRALAVHEPFLEQVARQPDAIALIDDRGSVTYRQLADLALQYCGALRARGVAGGVVGIAMPRERQLVAALLGTLMAGAAYVPLDVEYPVARLAHVVQSAGVRLVITSGAHAARVEQLGGEPIVHEPSWALGQPAPAVPGALAYVIYTSGSTGQPKGVQVLHDGVLARLDWARSALSAEERAVVLASTSINFDLSVFELFVPLCLGTTCRLVSGILDVVERGCPAVTLINTVPSAIEVLVNARAIGDDVRVALVAGEPFRQGLVERLYAASRVRRVLDLYGPTEDTIYSTVAERRPQGPETIGKPLPGTRAYLLDAAQQPVPLGFPGELYLAGAGSSAGYRNQDELTQAAFAVPDCLRHRESRVYRTGDIARYTEDGQLSYLGRKDHQVKIRGHRIELGEIESCLLAHPTVSEAVVRAVDGGTGHDQLVAYVAGAPSAGRADESALRSHLSGLLPPWMQPNAIVVMDRLPRNPNGKIDRAALPDPVLIENAAWAESGPGAAARFSGIERDVAQLWQELLGWPPRDARDHFIERGGNSLVFLELRRQLEQRFGVTIGLGALMATPVFRDQVQLLQRSRDQSAAEAKADAELEEVEL